MNIRPLITEKTMKMSVNGWYTFAVDRFSRKEEIRLQIHRLYTVDPIDIRTIVMKGKTHRVGKKRAEVKKTDWKKAMVRLKKGQSIEAFALGGQEEKK
jgi:large subunit ribosomal protein L23